MIYYRHLTEENLRDVNYCYFCVLCNINFDSNADLNHWCCVSEKANCTFSSEVRIIVILTNNVCYDYL